MVLTVQYLIFIFVSKLRMNFINVSNSIGVGWLQWLMQVRMIMAVSFSSR